MNLLGIDFETFYDRTYSLSKLTTEEYIRDPRFETIGVSVQRNDEEPVWFSGDDEEVADFLGEYDWDNSLAVAHNAMFDMAILSWRYGIRPKRMSCTLSMARALHTGETGMSLDALAKFYGAGIKGNEVSNAIGKRRADFTPQELRAYGGYCSQDVRLTGRLFRKMLPLLPVEELRLIDLTTRMFSEPVLQLNPVALQEHLLNVRARKDVLLAECGVHVDDLMSNEKLASVLRQLGIEPPMKTSPTTGKQAYAFAKSDDAFKALAEHEDERVQTVVAARLGVKSTLEETRTERFIEISKRGLFPVPLRYYAARTGRWGGADKINIQNLPRKSALKSAIAAPPGFWILDADSSQIEARILAWLAEQTDLVDAFARQEDVYKIMAAVIYSKLVEEITDPERFVGKTTILGAGYGMGAARFQVQLRTFGVHLPLEECEYIIRTYRETYPMIVRLWRYGDAALRAMLANEVRPLDPQGVVMVELGNRLRLPNGLHITYPNLRVDEETGEYIYDDMRGKTAVPTKIYGGKVIENVVQALARIVIGGQMLQIRRRVHVAMTVHDSVVGLVPEKVVQKAVRYVEQCMRTPPAWGLGIPLNCEVKVGPTYGDTKKIS